MGMVGGGLRAVLVLDRQLFRETCVGDFAGRRSKLFPGNISSTLRCRTGHCGLPRWQGCCLSSGPGMPGENVGSFWLTRPSPSFASVRAFSFATIISLCSCRRQPSSVGRPAHGCFRWPAVGSRQSANHLLTRFHVPAGALGGRQRKRLMPARVPGILLWPAAAMLLAAAAFSVWWQREFFFRWTPTRACRGSTGQIPSSSRP